MEQHHIILPALIVISGSQKQNLIIYFQDLQTRRINPVANVSLKAGEQES